MYVSMEVQLTSYFFLVGEECSVHGVMPPRQLLYCHLLLDNKDCLQYGRYQSVAASSFRVSIHHSRSVSL